jgi:hypothetical protein
VIPAKWFTVEISVQPFAGNGSLGRTLGAAVTLLANVSQNRTLVRDPGGYEVTAESTVHIPPLYNGTDASLAFPPESLVTYRGRTAKVITAKPFTRFGVAQFVELTTL